MDRWTSLRLLGAASTLAVGLTACSGAPNSGNLEGNGASGSTVEALSGNDAVVRAEQWVAVQVPYCQSPNGQPDPDPSCSSTCTRPSNPQWDPYRSDCSGFVSWAWALAAPGRTTSDFAPAVTDITQEIDGNTLMPGDALNIPGDHMVLFVAWNTPGQNATFYEEPGCSSSTPYAHSFTANLTISGSSVTVDYDGKTFTAIRYSGLTGTVGDGGAPDSGGTPCFVTTLGESGDCMSTAACAALGNHISTPGYCPGAADIQCCTALSMPEAGSDAGVPSGDSGTTEHDSGTGQPQEDSGAGTPTGPSNDGGGPQAQADDAGTNGAQVPPGWGTAANGCSVSSTPVSSAGAEIGVAGLALIAIRRRKRPSRKV